MKKLKVSMVQMNSGNNIERNFMTVKRFISRAVYSGSDLIVFPEVFLYRGSVKRRKDAAERICSKIIPELSRIAGQKGIAILCGTIPEKSPVEGKYYSTSILIDKSGKKIGKYRKIHLFDVNIKNKLISKESWYLLPGRKTLVCEAGGAGIGFAICYDLRFPEMFRKLVDKGARIIVLPADFSRVTGEAHWKALIRARAIENQVFMVCPNQWGRNPDSGKESYGHSMIVDPWGNIIAEAGLKGNRLLTAEMDFINQKKIRQELPCLKHRKLSV